MAEADFITAVDRNGKKRRVPKHYLDNPKFGYKLPPSSRVREPATPATVRHIHEPAVPENEEEVSE